MKTSLERIRNDIDSLAEFSATEGPGCCRQTYTKEFAAARDYITASMKEIGLAVREDAVGNIIGRMEGKNPDDPVIMTGSHFDTVRTGGRFDGLAGVVAALETARVMKEEGFVPNCPLEFVATAEEEGTRFSGGLFGSRAMCGQLHENELENSLDQDGISISEAMREYGLDPARADEAILDPEKVRMFIEMHIEQGPVLDREKTEIGIVDAIAGLRRWIVTVNGRSDHSGSTPMNMRADTMLAAARAIVKGTEKTAELNDGTMVTCGSVEVKPGAMNVVANQTVFKIDCRGKNMDSVGAVLEEIRQSLDDSVSTYADLSYEINEILRIESVYMSSEVQDMFEEIAKEKGFSCRRMLSGAGHDAMIMGSVCDVAMLFVPSRNGRSHVPEEWTDYEQLQKGTEIIYETVKRLASR